MIAERKELPLNWLQVLTPHRRRGRNDESFIDFVGDERTLFRILVRQNLDRSHDFSVILMGILPGDLGQDKPEFRILRYDGNDHIHRNTIEGNRIVKQPHIHRASVRYQIETRRPDGFAVETQRYHDLNGAWDCFCVDVNLHFRQPS